MFGKKTKEPTPQQIADFNAETERYFDDRIEKASRMEDPARKIRELNLIQEDIASHLSIKQMVIVKKAANARDKADIAGSGATSVGMVAAYVAASAVIVHPPLLLVMGPVWLVGTGITKVSAKKHAQSVKKKLEAASEVHTKNLNDKTALISEMMSTTVKDNVQEISKSPLFKDVMAVPGISDVFNAAAAKLIAAEPEPPAAEAVPPAAPKKPKQKPNYDKIKKAGGL